MEKFIVPLQIRWSDIDANKHLRHSVYYDFGAFCRMKLFTEIGITLKMLESMSIGPILLREEAVFRREILFEDEISMTTEIVKATEDFGRWSFRHLIFKNGENVAATISIDGAWLDVVKRKMAVPPESLRETFTRIPKAADFQVISLEKKSV